MTGDFEARLAALEKRVKILEIDTSASDDGFFLLLDVYNAIGKLLDDRCQSVDSRSKKRQLIARLRAEIEELGNEQQL